MSCPAASSSCSSSASWQVQDTHIPSPFHQLLPCFGLSQNEDDELSFTERFTAIAKAGVKTLAALTHYFGIPKEQLLPPVGNNPLPLLEIIYKANIVVLFQHEVNQTWGILPKNLSFLELFETVNTWLQNQIFKTTIEVSFPSFNISMIPEELSLFSNITKLDLSNNQIAGIPATVISGFRDLQEIDLRGNPLLFVYDDEGRPIVSGTDQIKAFLEISQPSLKVLVDDPSSQASSSSSCFNS